MQSAIINLTRNFLWSSLVISALLSGNPDSRNHASLVAQAIDDITREFAVKQTRSTLTDDIPNNNVFLESVGESATLPQFLNKDGLKVLVTQKRKAIWAFGGPGVQARRFDYDTLQPLQTIQNLSPHLQTRVGGAIELQTKGYGLALLWSEIIPEEDMAEQLVLLITPSCLENYREIPEGGSLADRRNQPYRVEIPGQLYPSDLISVMVPTEEEGQFKEIIVATYSHDPSIIQAFDLDGNDLLGSPIEIPSKHNIKLLSLDDSLGRFVACWVQGSYDNPGSTETTSYFCEIYTTDGISQPKSDDPVKKAETGNAFEGVHSLADLGNDRFVGCYTITNMDSSMDTVQCKIFNHNLDECAEYRFPTDVQTWNDPFVFNIGDGLFGVSLVDFSASLTQMFQYDLNSLCDGSGSITSIDKIRWLTTVDTNVKASALINDRGLFIMGFCEDCERENAERVPMSLQVYQMNRPRNYVDLVGSTDFQFTWTPGDTVVSGDPSDLFNEQSTTLLYDRASLTDPVSDRSFFGIVTSSPDGQTSKLRVFDSDDPTNTAELMIPRSGQPYLHSFPQLRTFVVCYLISDCYSFPLTDQFNLPLPTQPPMMGPGPVSSPTGPTPNPTGPTPSPTGPTSNPTRSTISPTMSTASPNESPVDSPITSTIPIDPTGTRELGEPCRGIGADRCRVGICQYTQAAPNQRQFLRCCLTDPIPNSCSLRSQCCGTNKDCIGGMCQLISQ